MDSNDIRSRLIEEELRSVWPGWHVARRLGGGSFGDVFQIYRDNYGIRVDSALKVIQMDDWMATTALPSNNRDESSPDIPEALRSEIQIMETLLTGGLARRAPFWFGWNCLRACRKSCREGTDRELCPPSGRSRSWARTSAGH